MAVVVHEINSTRLLGWIAELRNIGTDNSLGPGIHRPSLSTADLEARAWLRAKIEEHGLVEYIGIFF